jgi:hypothetical protein
MKNNNDLEKLALNYKTASSENMDSCIQKSKDLEKEGRTKLLKRQTVGPGDSNFNILLNSKFK